MDVDKLYDSSKSSREYIDGQMPEYILKECPKCGGHIQVFGLGPGGKADFSEIRVICWGCGKRMLFTEDKENKCYVEKEEKK